MPLCAGSRDAAMGENKVDEVNTFDILVKLRTDKRRAPIARTIFPSFSVHFSR